MVIRDESVERRLHIRDSHGEEPFGKLHLAQTIGTPLGIAMHERIGEPRLSVGKVVERNLDLTVIACPYHGLTHEVAIGNGLNGLDLADHRTRPIN